MTIDAARLQRADLQAARARLKGQAVVTPLLKSHHLDALAGGDVWLKCENLQRTGSFKFRGAYNALASMDEVTRARGIVAVSSGNHAQGVAEAARLFGVPATIVMPEDAPATKVARVRRSGGTIRFYDRYSEDRNAIAEALADREGLAFVRPFDDAQVIAGQGTAGLEIADQLAAEGRRLDVALICCGGGGLCAGVSTALRDAYPDAELFAVEPEHFDDTARSLAAGERLSNAPGHRSVCDAIVTEMPGALTFPINQRNGVRGLVVSDGAALQAVAFAMRELKLIVEPGGAVALAAVLSGATELRGKTVVAVLSGGNIDEAMLMRALQTAD